MGNLVKRDDIIDGNYGSIFPKTEDDKDSLFVFNGNTEGYTLTVKDNENNEIEIGENILGVDDINLGELVKEPYIINFNKVEKILSNAFLNLTNEEEKIEFVFKSESVEIEPKAFGSNFKALKSIRGYNDELLSVTLYSDSFESEDVLKNIKELKDVDIYLEGGWSKEKIQCLIKKKDGRGKIRAGNDFIKADEELFTKEELGTSLIKLDKRLVDKIVVEDKDSIGKKLEGETEKKAKERVRKNEREKVKEEIKATGKEIKTEGVTWNKINEDTQKKVVEAMISEFNNLDVYARIQLNERHIELTKEKKDILLVKDSVFRVSFIGSTVVATDNVFKRDYDGIKLRNNKANKDKARDMAKKMIKEYFENNKIVLGKEDLKGPGGILCKFAIDAISFKELHGSDIKLDNIEQIGTSKRSGEVLDLNSAKKLLDGLDANELNRNEEGKVCLTKDLYGGLLASIQLIAKKYKHRKDELGERAYRECIKSVNALKRSKINKKDGE